LTGHEPKTPISSYFITKPILKNCMHFHKYQGTGNDFVMIDDRTNTFPVNTALIAHLCDRRFGIGADGLILIQNAEGYDFKMVYFNADGNEGSMCGNGGRCAVRFAQDLGIFEDSTTFVAVDGPHKAVACEDEIFLKMSNVSAIDQQYAYDFMNTGSPHYVTFVENVETINIVTEGRKIRYNDRFEGGTNVNFVQILDDNTIYVRTYERGVEDETFSCGTGVTACALAAHLRHSLANPVNIVTKGGSLRVSFGEPQNNCFENIYLIGPAVQVFEGQFFV
jgi:diaminopimelate epimerase